MPFCRGKTAGAARLRKFIVRLLIVTYDVFVNLRTRSTWDDGFSAFQEKFEVCV
jgi:hypothetical protein